MRSDQSDDGGPVDGTAGPSTDLQPALATRLLAEARRSTPDVERGDDGAAPFGPRVDVPDTASPADQLASFMGRRY